MKKIQFYMRELRYGGIEKQVLLLANALSDIFRIEIIVLGKKEMIQLNLFKKVKLIELGLIDYNGSILQKRKLKNKIRELTIDSVDTIVSTDALFNDFLSHLDKKVNKIYWEDKVQKNISEHFRKGIQTFQHIVVPNVSLVNYYDQINIPISIVPFAIESKEVKSSFSKSHIIMAIGKLEKNKHYEDMIDVMELLLKKVPTAKLYIIGDGEERLTLRRRVKQKGLEQHIIFWGFLESDEVEEMLKRAQVFIGTRDKENFGVSFLEAMRFSLPCVSFESLPLHDIIKDEINGYLIKDRNKEEMAKQISTLLLDEELCKNMGSCSKEMSLIYEIQTVKSEWIKIL